MAILDDSVIAELDSHAVAFPHINCYLSVIITLAAANYPEEIPGLYERLLKDYIPKDKQSEVTRVIREGLTKSIGIVGAAKTGNALRALSSVTPDALRDSHCYRRDDSPETVAKRGEAFFEGIYGKNKEMDRTKTPKASPDYDFLVRELFYGHIFSYDGILNTKQTGQVIISALVGIDCPEQGRNHMIGMLHQGMTRDELDFICWVCSFVAEKCGVKFKYGKMQIPILGV